MEFLTDDFTWDLGCLRNPCCRVVACLDVWQPLNVHRACSLGLKTATGRHQFSCCITLADGRCQMSHGLRVLPLARSAACPALTQIVIRLSGRRTPHQDLEGPLIEITQPSISNRWATGGPPLVLISHPSGMTPDEEWFYTEDWLHLYVPKLGLDGNAHLPPPGKKKGSKGMARITGVPPWKTPCCRGRPYWTLACSLSTRSGWDGCSSQQQSSTSDSSFALPPAGFLQTNTRVHHTVSQDSPSRGAVTGHSQNDSSHAQTQATETGVQEPTTEQSRWFTTFDHSQLRLI